MTVMMTPAGVMNTETFVVILEVAVLAPARARNPEGKALVLVIDAAPCHGVDLEHTDVKPEIARLLLKYNAIMLCIPANTSTHLSPLDCCFFATWKNYLRRMLNNISAVYGDPEAAINQRRLELTTEEPDFYAGTIRSAFERAGNVEASHGQRTSLLLFCWIHVAAANPLRKAALQSWSKPGLFPYDKAKMRERVSASSPLQPTRPTQRCSPRVEENISLRGVLIAAKACLETALSVGTSDALAAGLDDSVDIIREKATAGQHEDRINACTLSTATLDKPSRQLTHKGKALYNLATLEEAMFREVSRREEAKQGKAAAAAADKAAKKAARDAEKAAKAKIAEEGRAKKKKDKEDKKAEQLADKAGLAAEKAAATAAAKAATAAATAQPPAKPSIRRKPAAQKRKKPVKDASEGSTYRKELGKSYRRR
jgi:colicin import membrane protein